MQSTNLEEIKAALWEQASHQCTKVRFGEAQVMAVKCRKGNCWLSAAGGDAGVLWRR